MESSYQEQNMVFYDKYENKSTISSVVTPLTSEILVCFTVDVVIMEMVVELLVAIAGCQTSNVTGLQARWL